MHTFTTFVVEPSDLDLVDPKGLKMTSAPTHDGLIRIYLCDLDLPVNKLELLEETMLDLELDVLKFDESDIPDVPAN